MRLLVVGGNGFLGSCICKAALARGWAVDSISASGRPFVSPAGHQPAWSVSKQMGWHKARADQPDEYAALAARADACVHTIGVLLEGEYKTGGVVGAAGSLAYAWSGGKIGGGDPMRRKNYGVMNRDMAITVAETFAASRAPSGSSATPSSPASQPSTPRRAPFVFISAADHSAPLVPRAYIETKRQAEAAIAQMRSLRGIFMRPGLMYHPALKPATTLPAALLDLSASVHKRLGALGVPTPAGLLRAASMLGPDVRPLANALESSPLHAETVARAVCAALEAEHYEGPLEVEEMRHMRPPPRHTEDPPMQHAPPPLPQ